MSLLPRTSYQTQISFGQARPRISRNIWDCSELMVTEEFSVIYFKQFSLFKTWSTSPSSWYWHVFQGLMALMKICGFFTATFKSIDQNPFFSTHRFCLVVELYKKKGPAYYDVLLGADTLEWHWTAQLRSFLIQHCLQTSFASWWETAVTFQQ